MRYRRGFTLVELVSVLAIASILMTLAMKGVAKSMMIDQDFRFDRESMMAENRLCDQFRVDLRLAEELLDISEDRVVVQHADTQTRYKIANSHVNRSVVRNGETIANEDYRMSTTLVPRFEGQLSERRASLVIERQTSLKHIGTRFDRIVQVTVGGAVGAPLAISSDTREGE